MLHRLSKLSNVLRLYLLTDLDPKGAKRSVNMWFKNFYNSLLKIIFVKELDWHGIVWEGYWITVLIYVYLVYFRYYCR